MKSAVLLRLLAVLMFLTSCAPQEPEVIIAEIPVTVEITREVTVQVIAVETTEVIREVEVTREIEVTRLVDRPVTVTFTPTPINTPTPSNTPTITPTPSNPPTPTSTSTPTPTPNLAQTATIQAYGNLAASKGSGFYEVGVDILSGKWRSLGTGNRCYWARYDSNQRILANHYGLAGGTVNIRATDYEVEFKDCGTWRYVENEEPILQANASNPKNDGFYTVGIEIVAGRWKSTGAGDRCYWARLDGNQRILGNHYGLAGGTVTVRTTDYEVHFEGCGTWEYQGP